MLPQIKDLCKNCTLCPLGRSQHTVKNYAFDPHVFSNMNKSKYVVIGQNPGLSECIHDEPFVGQSGKNFNDEVEKHGLTREMFYITNIVKCHTDKNRAPTSKEVKACRPILDLELMFLDPHLIITLGGYAFKRVCPKENYSKSLGTVKKVMIAGKERDVFPIYHPSGMNLAIKERKDKFEQDIKLLSKLIKHWEVSGYEPPK
jgi:DNA polymerase